MEYEPGDGAVVPRPGYEDESLNEGEDYLVTHETTTTMSIQRNIGDQDARRQIDRLAQTSAAAHHSAVEQISHVRQQQDVIASKTSEYLQQQHERQLAMQEQQEQLRRQVTEQRRQIEEHVRLLRAAEAAMGEQEQRLDSLAEAVRPHVEARWGLFAGASAADSTETEEHKVRGRPAREPTVTLATGANMPVPPLYRGSSKKEKREFMDSYMVYRRRVDALNKGTQTQVFVMPIGACIEQSTLVRICRFELFKPEFAVSEDDWKRYFLDARNPDFIAYRQLDVAMRGLSVDVQLQDAESRMSRLLADFYSAVDGVNMESIIHEDPKRVVGYLVDALRPAAFRAAIKDSLERPAGKSLKKDVSSFLRWLRPQMEEFMKFETHILAAQPTNNAASHLQQKGKNSRRAGSKPEYPISGGSQRHQPAAAQTNGVAAPANKAGSRRSKPQQAGGPRPQRSCFKCNDLTHSVFQCPLIKDFNEAKELYESKTGRKARPENRSVSVARRAGAPTASASRVLPCRVMDCVDTFTKPDSGAEVSLIAPRLVEQLQFKHVWLPKRTLTSPQVIRGVGATPITITEETNLTLRFDTLGGPLVLRNVVCLLSPVPLPHGVGDILLSDAVMERLGYDPHKLMESAQAVQSEYDLSDVGRPGLKAGVCAFGSQGAESTPEELGLSEAEDNVCFPVPLRDPAAVDAAMTALAAGIEDAKAKGASAEFLDEVRDMLEEKLNVFRMALGADCNGPTLAHYNSLHVCARV